MTRDSWIGVALVALSIFYLWSFVPRGWVPHDEGMLGQSAEHVLAGRRPHVGYEEPYTGGLSLLHAAAFRVFGVDLLHLRWVLFAAASAGQFLIYAMLQRFLSPIAAAIASWLALTWSFPNYFASLPSWWVLLSAVACLWSLIRFLETQHSGFAALAGLAAGMAVAFKQTGVYIVFALALALAFERGPRVIRIAVAAATAAIAAAILRTRLGSSETLYLLLPIAACSTLLVAGKTSTGSGGASGLWPAMLAMVFAAVPLGAMTLPYLANGQLDALIEGMFVLPQKRLQFASLAMGPAYFLLAGVPCVALVTPFATRMAFRSPAAAWLTAAGAAIVIAGAFFRYAPYQLLWQSGRGFAALLPVAACAVLYFDRSQDDTRRRVTFGAAAMLAWASLVQFPYAGAIYFCYAAPLAVVAGSAAASHFTGWSSPALKIWAAALLVFAVLMPNRGYLDSLGAWHEPKAFATPLDLPRAHLRVSAGDAASYRRVADLVAAHAGTGRLFAGPDAPEVHFLTGRLNERGVMFDFFSAEGEQGAASWDGTTMVVLNRAPQFSPRPSDALSEELRRVFPYGETAGRFEVRWR